MTPFLEPTPNNRPRGAVKINDVLIDGWIDFEVENNNYYSADTFRCRFSGANLPADRDVKWFSQQQDMFCELFIGAPADPDNYTPADLKSWIYGQVDDIDIDPISYTVEISGRDLTRMFIDTKTSQRWPNQTASQIATILAFRHELDVSGIQATTEQVGKYYEIDHVQTTDERSEWDLLNYLANVEGFKVWVRGRTLFFHPAPDQKTADPYKLIYQAKTGTDGVARANFEGIKFKRALTISRGIQVVIKSWNKKHGKGYIASWPTKTKSINVGYSKVGQGVQIYSKVIPNLSQDEAMKRAQAWYAQIVATEMNISVSIPGDNRLDTTSIIELSGTGTAFDQVYFPDCIARTMHFENGYSMTISAKNKSPESEVQL